MPYEQAYESLTAAQQAINRHYVQATPRGASQRYAGLVTASFGRGLSTWPRIFCFALGAALSAAALLLKRWYDRSRQIRDAARVRIADKTDEHITVSTQPVAIAEEQRTFPSCPPSTAGEVRV